MDNTVAVYLWGQLVGALHWDDKQSVGVFEYEPAFVKSGLEVAPFFMPLGGKGDNTFTFREHQRSPTFNGLPGLLADSLPDRFGNDILNAWLVSRGLSTQDMNPVTRLSYIGNRGMGALEFKPAKHSQLLNRSVAISISEMTQLCEHILQDKKTLDVNLSAHDEKSNAHAMNDILRIGSSAGGAKPKAIIAMDDAGHIISGQVATPEGYRHWMIKFDMAGDFDRQKNNGIPPASGRIEYAYYLMALEAGLAMHECRLLEIDEYGHFLTERFDRVGNEKLHVQTLSAIEHLDRDLPHDYAQLFATARKLNLGMPTAQEIFRRMVFNVLTYNHDDHTKNHAFMMDQKGAWSLTPAYDVTYAFDPTGKWTRRHQMSIFGKFEAIKRENLLTGAEQSGLSTRQAQGILDEVQQAVEKWTTFADKANLDKQTMQIIERLFRKSAIGG